MSSRITEWRASVPSPAIVSSKWRTKREESRRLSLTLSCRPILNQPLHPHETIRRYEQA